MSKALGAFSHVTVGVADLPAAERLWTELFGLEIVARRDGADPELARLWKLQANDVRRQAIVATPGAAAGRLHLVEWAKPGAAVREGAQVYDRLPKNLDLYTRDLPARYEALKSRGVSFRSPWLEMPGPPGLTFREVHLPGHDQINFVLLEVIGKGYDTPLSPAGFAGVGPLVTIVPDVAAEMRFYTDVLGMHITLELLLTGPDIERTVGLPPGAGLDLRVVGDPAEPLGRIEGIEYQQVVGESLYPRARPPAVGILHVNYQVDDLDELIGRLERAAVAFEDHGEIATLAGSGQVISFHSPAGLRLEVQRCSA